MSSQIMLTPTPTDLHLLLHIFTPTPTPLHVQAGVFGYIPGTCALIFGSCVSHACPGDNPSDRGSAVRKNARPCKNGRLLNLLHMRHGSPLLPIFRARRRVDDS